jgi:hypothetical protein
LLDLKTNLLSLHYSKNDDVPAGLIILIFMGGLAIFKQVFVASLKIVLQNKKF